MSYDTQNRKPTDSTDTDHATTADDRTCERCGAVLTAGDAPTESLLSGGVYCSPTCTSRAAGGRVA